MKKEKMCSVNHIWLTILNHMKKANKMLNIVYLIIGIVGLVYGFFIIFSVVLGKVWVDRFCKQKGITLFTVGDPFLNKIILICFGIGIIGVFGGLTYAAFIEIFLR